MLHDTYPVFFNFWRPSRYCSSSNHYVLRDSQQFRLISEGVASVSAVYQFLSLGQKSKVIFVPGSCLFFILSQNFLDIFFNLKKTYD
ncbi:hypothetical protein EB62_02295 [Enterococcus faecalis]|nr:hypothetical protein EB62_02295 [Enterococcus faecalis]